MAEVERIAADRRFVQLLLPVRSWDLYGHQRFWPIWDAAAEHGLALALTYGGASGQPPTPMGWLGSVYEEYVTGAQAFQAHLVSLVMGGVFDRLPNLRVVLAESGWTWLPALMWKMDAQGTRRFDARCRGLSDLLSVRSPPRPAHHPTTRCARRPNPQLAQVYAQLGSHDRMLMFASDYPHVHEDGIESLLAGLSNEQADRLLHRNAVDCYRSVLAPASPRRSPRALAHRGHRLFRRVTRRFPLNAARGTGSLMYRRE